MPNAGARPPVVAVFNHKGGVAKTTTATNVATCLAALGRRVVLVDFDPQGNATAGFGHTPLPTAGALDVITGRADFASCLLPTPFGNLTLLPATESLRLAELQLGGDEDSVQRLRAQVSGEQILGLADVVVIDCPPSFAMVTLNALYASTAVLIPTRPDPYAHEGLLNTWYEFKRMRQEANSDLALAGILLTLTQDQGPLADTARMIRAEFGERVYGTPIPEDVAVSDAARLSLPVVVLDPDGAAGRAYVAVTRELLARLGTELDDSDENALLNTLRQWRSEQVALERIPKRTLGWVEPAATGDDPAAAWTPESPPKTPDTCGRWRLVSTFLAGAALGVILGAVLRGHLV